MDYLKNQDLKIPYFYSIEFQKFSKIHQSHSDTKICQITGLSKNQDLKIPYFYSIEFQKFSKIHQSHSDTKICQINGLSKFSQILKFYKSKFSK